MNGYKSGLNSSNMARRRTAELYKGCKDAQMIRCYRALDDVVAARKDGYSELCSSSSRSTMTATNCDGTASRQDAKWDLLI